MNDKSHPTLGALHSALAATLSHDCSYMGVEDAMRVLREQGCAEGAQVRPAALNCDGTYEAGYEAVITTDEGVFSGVACDLLWPAVQVQQHPTARLRLRDFS